MRSKFLSLVLALSMIFSLSITAFAVDGDTNVEMISVTLKVANNKPGAATFEEVSVDVPEGTSIYTLLTQFNHEDNDDSESDELWTVTGSAYDGSWFMNSMSYGGKTYATEPCDDPPAGFKGKTDAWNQGYGLVSAPPDSTTYHYYYAGYAWMYNVAGELDGQNVNVLALNEFILHNENVITLTYDLQTSEWEMAKPYTNVYPYLPVNP